MVGAGNLLIPAIAGLLGVATLAGLVLAGTRRKKKTHLSNSRRPADAGQNQLNIIPTTQREPDALYQWSRFRGDRVVARVLQPEINEAGKEIHFAEVYNSDDLLLPEECAFQKYKILIRRIESASKVAPESGHKGRILRGVTADILGYREQ